MGAITTAVMIGATVAKGVSDYNTQMGAADQAKEQAGVEIAKGKLARFQQKQESERVRKSLTAEAGRGGGSLSGSYLENLNASMTNAQLDEEMITYNAEVMAANYRQSAKNLKTKAIGGLLNTAVSAASMGASQFGGVENMGQVKTGIVPKPGIKPVR